MPFNLLKQIVKNLQKVFACPFCKSVFPESCIFILASSPLNSLFFIVCPQCLAQTFVMVTAMPRVGSQNKEMVFTTRPATGVTVNDVLDMHNLLKNFEGDLCKLFK